MDITIQIKTILFSIIFGIIFSAVIDINYKFLIKNKIINILITFILITAFVLVYFILLRHINYGIFHPYEVLCITIGFILEKLIHATVEKIRKK